MPDVHVNRRLLEAVSQGRLSAHWLRVYYAQHARELGAFQSSPPLPSAEPPTHPPTRLPRAAYAAVTQRVIRRAVAIEQALEDANREQGEIGEIGGIGETSEAARMEAALAALPAAERFAHLRRAVPGPWAMPLAYRLLERARPRAGSNLAHAQEWAALVRECAQWLADAEPRVPATLRGEVEILALAFDAHAHCLAGNVKAADEGFAQVQSVAHRMGWLDPVLQAELHVLEAGLRRAQCRWPVAERLYRRAASLLHQIEAHADAGRVEVRLFSLLRQTGRREEAALLFHLALGHLRPALELTLPAVEADGEAAQHHPPREIHWAPASGPRRERLRRTNR